MSWPGEDEPVPLVFGARPGRNRPRMRSDQQQLYVDGNGNLLMPFAQGGRPVRAASVGADGRPANIIINNEIPVEAFGGAAMTPQRSHSRVRMRPASPYEDVLVDDGGRITYFNSAGGYTGGRRPVDTDTAIRLRKLAELEEKDRREAELEKLKKEIALKRAEEESEKRKRKEEDEELEKKAIEKWKKKEAKRKEKEKEEKEEKEEEFRKMLMLGQGLTLEEAERVIKRAERKERRGSTGGFGSGGVGDRPTYIKVHKRYLMPETLNAFRLPWGWDDRDGDYLVIKQWISESDQDVLFEHTAKLKANRRLEYPRDALKRDADVLFIKRERKKSPVRRIAWF